MIPSVANRAFNLAEEAYRIGWQGFTYRLWDQFGRRTGIDVKLRRVQSVDDKMLGRAVSGLSNDEQFYKWWLDQPTNFFVNGWPNDQSQWIGQGQAERAKSLGQLAADGCIFAFRGWSADFGNSPVWDLNPTNGKRWPGEQHARRVLNDASRSRVGDIKFTWEIGRFLHIADVVRATAISKDEALIDRLFDQISSFEEQNPLHRGPHWLSEQEVGIRVAMFAYLLYTLRGSGCLNGARVRLLLRQMAAGASYCYHDTHLARFCINNNHLLGGVLGMYLPACVMPWHEKSRQWKTRGRRLLVKALREQWQSDGGYTQPSHNYHRLAQSYLLWFLRLAEIQRDDSLCRLIRGRMQLGFELLSAMCDESSGMLPNWGPNDGALFCPWTSCNYSDFRPLLTSLRYALDGYRQFDNGPWDEQLVWLWGEDAARASVKPHRPHRKSFLRAGLHLLQYGDDKMVFRCGSVFSRYGQQADQLHLDLWWRGANVLLDTGSCSYGDHAAHQWFRSTDAHNTVVVDGQSQMVPHRQFLFLRWTKAKLLDLPSPPAGIRGWFAGYHDGYRRLSRTVRHARLVASTVDGDWLVVDRLYCARTGTPLNVCQRWHFMQAPVNVEDDQFTLTYPLGDFTVVWCGSSDAQFACAEAAESPMDGWTSRVYGTRQPTTSVRLTWELHDSLVIATVLGANPHSVAPHCDGHVVTFGDIQLDAKEILGGHTAAGERDAR